MSVLAEIILAYADRKLYYSLKKYKNIDYKIIRYRDDYKIFVQSKAEGDIILKELSEILRNFNLKVHLNKTKFFEDIVLGSLKSDKYAFIQYFGNFTINNIQKRLIRLHAFLDNYPNSGQAHRLLSDTNDDIVRSIQRKSYFVSKSNFEVLIGICTQIAFKNPSLFRTYCLLLSTLLSIFSNDEAVEILQKIYKKFSLFPHNSVFKILLQRLALAYGMQDDYGEKLCTHVLLCLKSSRRQMDLWDFTWLQAPDAFRTIVFKQQFIEISVIKSLKKVLSRSETDIFTQRNYK